MVENIFLAQEIMHLLEKAPPTRGLAILKLYMERPMIGPTRHSNLIFYLNLGFIQNL